MAEPTSSSAAAATAAVGWSIKSGMLAGVFAVVVSVVAIVVGFTVIPLQKGKEMADAARRLAAGMLCSFVFGPALAFKAIEEMPWLLTTWETILRVDTMNHADRLLWAYLAAAAPFIAVSGLVGFWVVAASMRWFDKRRRKDIGELLGDVTWFRSGRGDRGNR